jgi:hypothetical protein
LLATFFSSPVPSAVDEASARGTIAEGLATCIVSLWVNDPVGGSGWTATEGEADAARSCSSRLGVPIIGDEDDFATPGNAGLIGAWNGNVDGSCGCWASGGGNGKVASLKRRPLQTQECQWNGTRTIWQSAHEDAKQLIDFRDVRLTS